MIVDENLASIHAYLCADGYVIKNPSHQKQKYYRIGLRNTNLVLLKDFQKKFEKIFRTKPWLMEGQRCEKGSKDIYGRLIEKFGSFYSWEWKMLELDGEKLLSSWLRTFFDCEGWVVCKSRQNRHIGLDCVNEIALIQVKEALKKLNINSQIKKRDDRNIFSLKIYGKENIINFRDRIDFLHPEKKRKLNIAINDYMNYYWDFPNNKIKLKKFIKEIMCKKAKIKKPNYIVYIISNKEENLTKLRGNLAKLFNIESRLYKRRNGIGTPYYEIDINKKEDIKKLILNKLLNKEEAGKWLK